MGGDSEDPLGYGHPLWVSYIHDGVADACLLQPAIWSSHRADTSLSLIHIYQRCVLAAFFSRLNTKDYPLSEWNDALEYLTHAKKAHDSATAHELLLEHLRALQCG